MNGNSERSLKITAYIISIFFTVLILLPLIYLISNSLKDDTAVYEAKPKFIPNEANSISVVLDYSGFKNITEEKLLDILMKDSTTALYTIPYELNKQSIYEIKVYGIMDGKTIFYTRAHKGQIRLELDFGIYQRVAVSEKGVLFNGDKYIKSSKLIGYDFNIKGIETNYSEVKLGKNNSNDTIDEFLTGKYSIQGKFAGTIVSSSIPLMLESFKYYFKLPAYTYGSSDSLIKRYSFFIFMFNTVVVIGFAIIIQTLLCSLTAYPLSKLFKKKISDALMVFFLATIMVPFVCILVPQFMMFKSLGFYNNYAALLIPFLYPAPMYIFFYKGFFDQIPSALFEAAKLDGASEIYTFARICMPLSKPIISIIALQIFLTNWNDFFWAWMVIEKPRLWTLNLAIFNFSNNEVVKQNFLMGLSIVTIVPVMLLTVLFSDQIKRSIASSGIKG